MSPEQLNAILLKRLECLEDLLVAKDERISGLERELREWKAGSAGPTNRQRRRVRGAKPAKNQPQFDKPRPAGRKKGHKGAGRKNPDNIDVVLTVRTTQYKCHRHHCTRCQKAHLAPLPAGLGGAVRIGPRALALAAWMRFDMRQSIGNIPRFFTEGIGLSWPKGSIKSSRCFKHLRRTVFGCSGLIPYLTGDTEVNNDFLTSCVYTNFRAGSPSM